MTQTAHKQQRIEPAGLMPDVVRNDTAKTTADDLYEAGCGALSGGSPDRARAFFSEALRASPGHPGALFNMGVALYRGDHLEDAEGAFRRFLEVRPSSSRALRNLGLVRRNKDDVPGSLDAFWTALTAAPEDPAAWSTFSNMFQQVRFDGDSNAEKLLSLLLVLLARDEVDHHELSAQTVRLLRRSPGLANLLQLADSRNDRALSAALFDDEGAECLRRLVLRLALERSVLPDPGFEHLFTFVRRAALQTLVAGRPAVPSEVITSIARQCYLTGYLWAFSDDEQSMVEWMIDSMSGRALGSDPNDEIRIAILASYVPLCEWDRAEEVLSLAEQAGDPALADLAQQQISEPVREFYLTEVMPSFGDLQNKTSVAVRQQYEEHPYTRWTTVAQGKSMSVAKVLKAADVAPWPPAMKMTGPDILVAGCGTGKPLIEFARRFTEARITGIDLSAASLAYAARKADEAGLGGIALAQADILGMDKWPGRFDIVDACGVLHHMEDPLEGWRVLCGLLRPGGLMRIGLYSELARAEASAARELINAEGLDATPEGIRAARHALYQEYGGLAETPLRWRDFYSIGACRDLLFPIKEHRFTLPQIEDAIYDLGLRFLGFELPSVEVRGSFRSRFEIPGAKRPLAAWHRFETEFPDTFSSMYQFWVGKPE